MKTIGTAAAVIALIGSIWAGFVVADTRYVKTSDFGQYVVEDFYEKYYAAEDRMLRAQQRGDAEGQRKARRDMERLRAKICKIEPDWERCG